MTISHRGYANIAVFFYFKAQYTVYKVAGLFMLQILDRNTQLEILEEKYRREAFASFIASGMPSVKAMRNAGYINANRDLALSLLLEEDVKAMIRAQLDKIAETCLASKEMLVQELDFNREFAIEMENPAAAVAATVAKAKLMGYFENDKLNKVPNKIEITWGTEGEKQTEVIRDSSPLYEAIKEATS
jgi:hypothetical protein